MTKPKSRKRPSRGQPRSRKRVGDEHAFPFHEHIGRHLKALYDDVASEPVPEKFRKLLEALGRRQSHRK